MACEYAGHFSCEPHDETPIINPAASKERAITFFIVLFLILSDKATKVSDRYLPHYVNALNNLLCMNEQKINLPPEWLELLEGEFAKPYMNDLRSFIANEYRTHEVYPPKNEIFSALQTVLPADVKVVIIGQDPYHGKGQANGMCFSVNDGIAFPPSLRNIFKELESDIGASQPTSGNLHAWASQGVLLLNATLTVRKGDANSHQNSGWGIFTDRVISELNRNYRAIAYMLWGSFAQQKAAQVDQTNNLILKAPHPSPFSAHKGFLGCKHFSKANAYLISHGKQPINWQLN